MRHSIFFLACVALSAAAAAQSTIFPLVSDNALFVPNWLPLVGVGLALAAGLITIAFMVGEAFQLANVKSFARQETYELLMSVILVLIVIGSLFGLAVFANNVSGSTLVANQPIVTSGFCQDSVYLYPDNQSNPENSLYRSVDWFLGCMPTDSQGLSKYDNIEGGVKLPYNDTAPSVYQSAEWAGGASKGVLLGHLMNIYIGLFTLELPLGTVSTFGVSFYLPEGLSSSISLDFAPHAGLSPVSEVTITLTDIIGVGVGAIFTQKILLQFFHQNALAIFLPLGIAFRAVPFLRKTGSTIIAVALVAYFIFPLSIWINQQVYFAMQGPLDTTTGQYQHPVLTDWVDYHTLLQICMPNGTAEAADPQAYRERVTNDIATPFVQQSENVSTVIVGNLWDPTSANGDKPSVRLPDNQLSTLARALGGNFGLVLTYLAHPGFIAGPVLPVDFLYDSLVDQITVSAQWFALNLIFLVNTILICITLFRDISLSIGGEPRIFGMSKLV